MPNVDLIPTAEAAQVLQLDVSTVLRLVRDKKITPAMKIPGKTGAYLFDRAAIEQLAAERTA